MVRHEPQFFGQARHAPESPQAHQRCRADSEGQKPTQAPNPCQCIIDGTGHLDDETALAGDRKTREHIPAIHVGSAITARFVARQKNPTWPGLVFKHADIIGGSIGARQQHAIEAVEPQRNAEGIRIAPGDRDKIVGVEQRNRSAIEFALRRLKGARHGDGPDACLRDRAGRGAQIAASFRISDAQRLPIDAQVPEPGAIADACTHERRNAALDHLAGRVRCQQGTNLGHARQPVRANVREVVEAKVGGFR